MTCQAKLDWKKVSLVIKSINNMVQVECAKNLIKNYKKMYGIDCNHKLLELQLKSKCRELK